MSTAIVKDKPQTIERALAELPKGELVQRLVMAKGLAKKHRIQERAAHGGKVVLGAVLAGVGGAAAGLIDTKLPYIPKTKVRTTLALGGALSALAALNFFGTGVTSATSHYINDLAKGLIGAGTAEHTKSFLVNRGAKVAA
jgi:hypothetical protein